MQPKTWWLASALAWALVLAEAAVAQPPGRRGGPPGPFGRRGGPRDGLDRVLDDMSLSGEKRDAAEEAVRAYRENGRRAVDLAGAGLMLKLKEALSPEEFKKLREATERFRRGPGGPAGRGLGADE